MFKRTSAKEDTFNEGEIARQILWSSQYGANRWCDAHLHYVRERADEKQNHPGFIFANKVLFT